MPRRMNPPANAPASANGAASHTPAPPGSSTSSIGPTVSSAASHGGTPAQAPAADAISTAPAVTPASSQFGRVSTQAIAIPASRVNPMTSRRRGDRHDADCAGVRPADSIVLSMRAPIHFGQSHPKVPAVRHPYSSPSISALTVVLQALRYQMDIWISATEYPMNAVVPAKRNTVR